MFVPQSRPFSEIASDLYLPRSFETPPPGVNTPPADPEWLHYGPDASGTAPPFGEFMGSRAFRTIQQQFLQNVDHCEDFARSHFSPQESEAIQKDLQAFRRKLQLNDGLLLVGIDRLPVLYGIGKQSFDTFCMLLDHPGIELHQRKVELRELASQASTCLGTGPAFTHALMQLQRPDGSLQGQYWQVMQDVMDAVLRRFVYEVWEGRKGRSIGLVNAHLVNRFRLELGLPGTRHYDLLSEGSSLVTQEEVQECAQMLLRDCRPTTMALQLARRYRERLVSTAATMLGGDGSTPIDPDSSLHMDMLRAAADRLAPTFPGTSLKSLVKEDLDTGVFMWRQDDSLVAHDLLRELVRQGYVRKPEVGVLMRSASTDSAWAVRHIDDRLVYLQEYMPGSGPRGENDSVGMHHLLCMRPFRPHPALARMVTTVVEAESPEALMRFPVEALGGPSRTSLLLRRLGAERSVEWVRTQPLTDVAIRLLLRAATDEGHAGVLTHLFQRLAAMSPMAFISAGGGPDVLARSLAGGDPATALFWIQVCGRALATMPPSTVEAVLENGEGQPLLHAAMLRSPTPVLSALMGLVHGARATGGLNSAHYVRHVCTQVDEAMKLDRLEALELLGHHVADAARRGWLVPSELAVALEGPVTGQGCLGAAIAGSAAGVRWFTSTIVTLAEEGSLHRIQAGVMLSGGGNRVTAQAEAADVDDAEVLAAVLEGVVAAARRGWISERRLAEAMTLSGDGVLSGLARILLREDGLCARVWTDALLTLHECQLISPAQIAALFEGPQVGESHRLQREPGFVGAPLPFVLAWPLDSRIEQEEAPLLDDRLAGWAKVIGRLAEAGALRHEQLLDLLAARQLDQPALRVAMLRNELSAMDAIINACFAVRAKALISEQELEMLLDVSVGAPPTGWRINPGVANDFIEMLEQKVREGRLSGMAYARLTTPYLRHQGDPANLARFQALTRARKAARASEQRDRERRPSL